MINESMLKLIFRFAAFGFICWVALLVAAMAAVVHYLF